MSDKKVVVRRGDGDEDELNDEFGVEVGGEMLVSLAPAPASVNSLSK